MTKRILLCFAAVLLTLGIVLTGCTEEPTAGDRIDLTVLIRTEDERQEIGDYTAGVLEDLGFKVTRQYGISSELGPIWQGEPSLGEWHAYTGGWISTAIERDAGTNFGFFYTTIGMAWMPIPLWAAYTDEGTFYDVCEKLWVNDFSTAAEREDLFEAALWGSMEDSVRPFLLDRTSFSPLQTDVHMAADAYAGIYGCYLWALTAHFRDASGVPQLPDGSTTLRMSTTDLFIDPWNPVGGSNWAYDMYPIRGTHDQAFAPDPNTGLFWPHRAVDAELTWVDGLPIVTDPLHTWLTSSTVADPIPVPGTAWADWDATTGEWLTAAEVHGDVTAKVKAVVRYPDTIFTTPLHDGSTLSKGDFLLYAVQWFDRANADSDYYDESHAPPFDAFMSQFKGMEWNFNPGPGYGLEITSYSDQYYLDAELVFSDYQFCWFPADEKGPFAWHNVALGMLAERDGELAFSQDKADTLEVEWTSFIDGPSLDVLAAKLADVQNSGHADYRFLPYASILGDYVDTAEIDARYSNLAAWYASKGHFWVAGGPYFLEATDTLGKVIELNRFADYPDDATRWFFTMTPVPTSAPAHTGGWVDVITIEVDDNATAVSKLQGDLLDVYAFAIADADLKDTCDADDGIWYYENAGSFNDITLNPDGPFFGGTGEPNPFALLAVREALNMAIDRDYICGTIMQGMAIPRYTCVGDLSGDGIKYAGIIDAIEDEYAYDFEAADAAIEEAMLALPGVTRDELGHYYWAAS